MNEKIKFLIPSDQLLTDWAGFPKTVSPALTGAITTEPAPTRDPLPMVIPDTIVTPEPIKASSPMETPALMTEPDPI